jgi:hypothetical protein
MVFVFQVWGTVSSEDFQATWGVEWGSVARWAVAITVHFEVSDAVVLCDFNCIGFCEGVMRTFKRTVYCVSSCRLLVHLYLHACMVPLNDVRLFLFVCLLTRSGSLMFTVYSICKCLQIL